ncbi:hypothetical protein LCGC14_1538830 [marine sediment metagenome]|uniref:Tetratricopeptide repeat protein n=1 Tax=marine sediment metagenome TaxID=412755 RepID=A0A0F9JEL9_9ZZZZ
MNAVLLICVMLSQNPQEFLQSGEVALQAGNWQEASDNFYKAINTNELNIGGQAVSYWNVFISERNMNHVDKSMEALLAFIVYGSDFVTSNDPNFKMWARKFNVKLKLNYSIVLIQAVWAKRNNYSCKSKLFACYVPTEKLINVFEETIPFCGNSKDIIGAGIINKDNIIKFEIQCRDGTETYYFQL